MSEQQSKAEEPRRSRHVARSTEGKPKEEETKTYRVKEGQTWGTNPPLEAGDTVELTEAEAAGFEDKLEPADTPKQPPTGTEGTTPSPSGPSVPRRPS